MCIFLIHFVFKNIKLGKKDQECFLWNSFMWSLRFHSDDNISSHKVQEVSTGIWSFSCSRNPLKLKKKTCLRWYFFFNYIQGSLRRRRLNWRRDVHPTEFDDLKVKFVFALGTSFNDLVKKEAIFYWQETINKKKSNSVQS